MPESPLRPNLDDSNWLLSAQNISITNQTGTYNGQIQSEPVFMNRNGRSANFNIYVRSQITGQIVDTIQGAFQLTLTPTGTFNLKGEPQYLLNLASSFVGSAQTTIACPGGRFGGIGEISDTPNGVSMSYISPENILDSDDIVSVSGLQMQIFYVSL